MQSCLGGTKKPFGGAKAPKRTKEGEKKKETAGFEAESFLPMPSEEEKPTLVI